MLSHSCVPTAFELPPLTSADDPMHHFPDFLVNPAEIQANLQNRIFFHGTTKRAARNPGAANTLAWVDTSNAALREKPRPA